MTATIAVLLAAHAAGKPVTATIERLTIASPPMKIGRCSSPSARKPRLWRLRSASRRQDPRASRSTASRSSSRTISMSPACRRRRPVRLSPIAPAVRRSSSSGSSALAQSSSARPTSISSRPGSSAYARPTAFRAMRSLGSHPWRVELRLGDGGWRGPRFILAWHRHGGIGARAGGAQRHCRAEAVARDYLHLRRRPRLPHARHRLDLRPRCRRRLHRLSRGDRVRRTGRLQPLVP